VRWALLLGVVAGVGACDRAFGLTTVTPSDGVVATVDAIPDASPPPLPCATTAGAPYFCADFDQGSAAYFQYGTMFSLATSTSAKGSAGWSVTASAVSPPGALHIVDDAADQFYLELSPAHADVSALTASFDLEIESPGGMTGNVTTGFMWLQTSRAAGDCLASFTTDTGNLILQSHCNNPDVYRYATIVQGIPQGWNHVEMSLDTRAGQATLVFAGQPAVPLDLATTTPGGTPFVRIGAVDSGTPGVGWLVGLDNVVVTVR